MLNVKSAAAWPLVLLVFWMWILTPGKIAGVLNPVVDAVEITAEQDEIFPSWVTVAGSFLKLRDQCRPLRIDWFLGSRQQPGPPIEYIWGAPEIRYEGQQVFEDWRVRAAPPTVLMTGTFADVIHKCGFVVPFIETRLEYPWETRTSFWN